MSKLLMKGWILCFYVSPVPMPHQEDLILKILLLSFSPRSDDCLLIFMLVPPPPEPKSRCLHICERLEISILLTIISNIYFLVSRANIVVHPSESPLLADDLKPSLQALLHSMRCSLIPGIGPEMNRNRFFINTLD